MLLVIVGLLVALNVVAARLFAARQREQANVLNVSSDVARYWLALDEERRENLTERARDAGWGVAEWLQRLHRHADLQIYAELREADPHGKVAAPSREQVDRRMEELIYTPFAQEPPERSIPERLLEWVSIGRSRSRR